MSDIVLGFLFTWVGIGMFALWSSESLNKIWLHLLVVKIQLDRIEKLLREKGDK